MDANSGHDRDAHEGAIEIPPEIVLEVAGKFTPSRTRASVAWRRNLQEVRQRCEDCAGSNVPLKCVLTHSVVPEWPQRPEGPYPTEVEGLEPVAMGVGPSRWPNQYFLRKQAGSESVVSELDPSSEQSYRLRTLGLRSKLQFGEVEFVPMVGEQVVQNVTGSPILFSDGQPVAMRVGANRNYFVHAGGNPKDQITSISSFFAIASEAGHCLMSAPAEVSQVVWKEWPDGFRTIGDKGLWISALFELAWQQRLGESVRAPRFTWDGPKSFPLNDLTIGAGEMADRKSRNVDTEDPPHWYSVISDLVSSSIAAVDSLLALAEKATFEG